MGIHPWILIGHVVEREPATRYSGNGLLPRRHRPYSQGTSGNRKTFSFITKEICAINLKKQVSRRSGADGRKLSCINCARQWGTAGVGGLANTVTHFGISCRWKNRLTSWATINFSTSSVLCSAQITLRSAHQLQERNSNMRDQKVVCGYRKALWTLCYCDNSSLHFTRCKY